MDKILLKGKFVCFEKEFYGIFLIFIDPEMSNEEYIVAAGSSSFISTYSVELNGDQCIEVIKELMDDGEASSQKSKEIKGFLQGQIDTIKRSLKEGFMKLEETLIDLFKNYINASVEIALAIDRVDSFPKIEMEREREEKEIREKDQEFRKKYKIPHDVNIIECFPILSPIKGKLIKEIEEGELVLTKIDDTNPLGQQIARDYNLYSKDQTLKPVVGKTYSKYHDGDDFVIILQLAPDLFGLAREDEAVKITCVKPENIIQKVDKAREKIKIKEYENEKKTNKKEQVKNEMFIYVSVGILVIVLALFFLIFS